MDKIGQIKDLTIEKLDKIEKWDKIENGTKLKNGTKMKMGQNNGNRTKLRIEINWKLDKIEN